VNVWLALLRADHVHRDAATRWWAEDESDVIGFCRFTQVAVLRLLTTAAAMNDKPLTLQESWNAYDRLFADDRVSFVPEPFDLEITFRTLTQASLPSPKTWADAYLAAFAERAGGRIVTFDKALSLRAAESILLA